MVIQNTCVMCAHMTGSRVVVVGVEGGAGTRLAKNLLDFSRGHVGNVCVVPEEGTNLFRVFESKQRGCGAQAEWEE